MAIVTAVVTVIVGIIVKMIVVGINIAIVTVRVKPRAGRLDVSNSVALAAAYTKADHPDGKGPADLNELAGGRPLTAREVEKLLPARVTVGGVHRPLRTDAGAGLWDEEAMHFTMCNMKRALWYSTGSRLPRHLRRRQLTGEEQTRLEQENKQLRALVRELEEKLKGGT